MFDCVDLVRTTSRHVLALDNQRGGGWLVDMALNSYRSGLRHMDIVPPRQQRDMQAAVGEAAQVAAWVAHDAYQPELSRSLNQEALRISVEAGDRWQELFVMSNLAHCMLGAGDCEGAMRVCETALNATDVNRRVRGLFLTRRGRARTMMGDRGGIQDMDEAVRLLSEEPGPRDPRWAWWLSSTYANGSRACALSDLGDWATAYEAHADNLITVASPRSQYLCLISILRAAVRLRSWREATGVISRIMPYLGAVGSIQGNVSLRDALRSMIKAPSSLRDQAGEVLRLLPKGTDKLPGLAPRGGSYF